MEKKQYELCLEILRRFHKTGILNHFILIGSWCAVFYEDYFGSAPYLDQTTLKTRDIDFLVNTPSHIKQKVDIPDLLKDLGFITTFHGTQGYIKLDHPDLTLEFLVPERGRGIEKPYSLPQLGLNAVALRFLEFLSDNTIKVKVEDFSLTLPHPVHFALHKLIIFQRRTKKDKAIKDRSIAIDILEALIKRGEVNLIQKAFKSVSVKWQTKIVKGLQEAEEKEILKVLL
ncbi:MAG: hypothetical protein HY590_03810 [Candidatus Omnitrophica bacterium]|nr:hypothetical protein [Candidatus Omnitrophota bacterium]